MCYTQHSEPDDADVAPPSVGEVVDQALVGARVRQLGVVDEDGGTCAGHGGHEAHSAVQVVGQAEHLTALVDDHLEGEKNGRISDVRWWWWEGFGAKESEKDE